MPSAARLGDSIAGTTAGEHSGHATPHSPLPITGSISGNCSGDVFINGQPAAYVGSVTTENDACCGSSQGSVGAGSGTVFINCGNSTHVEPNLLLEIDHIIPVSKGGLTSEENLQTLCWKCNRAKSDKIVVA